MVVHYLVSFTVIHCLLCSLLFSAFDQWMLYLANNDVTINELYCTSCYQNTNMVTKLYILLWAFTFINKRTKTINNGFIVSVCKFSVHSAALAMFLKDSHLL